MKTVSALLATSAALGLMARSTDARPMHAGINYARYLQEADSVEKELNEWMSKYGKQGEKNGWVPQAESRDADEVLEDRKQRFFMSRELVDKLQKENPGAIFSTDSPFSLLTTAEFQERVRNGFHADDSTRRMLRAAPEEDDSVDGNAPVHGYGNSYSFSFGDINSNSNSNGNQGGNFNNGAEFGNEFNGNGNRNGQGNGNGDFNNNGGGNFNNNGGGNFNNNGGGNFNNNGGGNFNNNGGGNFNGNGNGNGGGNFNGGGDRNNEGGNQGGDVPRTLPVAPDLGPNAQATKEIGLDGSGVDWSTNKQCMPPVQTQGTCASCWAFSTIAATEFGQCVSTKAKSFVKLSEQQVTTCDTSNSGCRSGWPNQAFDYIKQNGVCSGSDIPYTMQNGQQANCRTDCKRIPNNLKGWSRVKGEDGLIAALKKQPVVVAVSATNNIWKQYKSGVISSCDTTQLDHAVLAVGFDKTSIKIRNSWSPAWGEGGYMRIKRDGGRGVCGVYEDMVHANF